MSDQWYDSAAGDFVVINESGIPESEIASALGGMSGNTTAEQAYKVMTAWMENTHRRNYRGWAGTFQRDNYVTPRTIFQMYDTAERACEQDDVVAGVYESTESLAFTRMHLECRDENEYDIWQQIYEDLDLDSRLREMWYDLFRFSTVYYGVYWGTKTYKVRGSTTSGNSKRKIYKDLKVPLGITILDPRKVIPSGMFMFNKENLVYIASPTETEQFDQLLDVRGDGLTVSDPIVAQLVLAEFPFAELGVRHYLNELGYQYSNLSKLYLLNPNNVFRHTLTRPQYKAIAYPRMRSIFDLLDIKQQLREMDRATLLGATNWILLIKKGTDQMPASRAEVQTLSAYVQTSARVPVIVGDHRLNIEIISTKTDNTLRKEKYDLIDSRLTARLFQMFVNPTGREEDSLKLARVIAAGMENRRESLKRNFVRNVVNPVIQMNEQLNEDDVQLVFNPRHIALAFDFNLAHFLSDLRDRGELSRETLLSEFNYDQDEEAWKRTVEKQKYDDIFETSVPFATQRPVTLQQTGQPVPAQPGVAPPGVVPPTPPPSSANPPKPGPQPKPKPTGVNGPNKNPAGVDPKAAGRNLGGNRKGGGARKPSNKRGKTTEQNA